MLLLHTRIQWLTCRYRMQKERSLRSRYNIDRHHAAIVFMVGMCTATTAVVEVDSECWAAIGSSYALAWSLIFHFDDAPRVTHLPSKSLALYALSVAWITAWLETAAERQDHMTVPNSIPKKTRSVCLLHRICYCA